MIIQLHTSQWLQATYCCVWPLAFEEKKQNNEMPNGKLGMRRLESDIRLAKARAKIAGNVLAYYKFME